MKKFILMVIIVLLSSFSFAQNSIQSENDFKGWEVSIINKQFIRKVDRIIPNKMLTHIEESLYSANLLLINKTEIKMIRITYQVDDLNHLTTLYIGRRSDKTPHDEIDQFMNEIGFSETDLRKYFYHDVMINQKN